MVDQIDNLNPLKRAARCLQAPQHVQFDELLGQYVVSSAAFKKQSDGSISVDLEEALESDGLPLDAMYGKIARTVGLVAHTVGRLTQAGLQVTHDKVPGNEYHGSARGNASKSERVALADTCQIIRDLDQDEAKRQHELEIARRAAERHQKG